MGSSQDPPKASSIRASITNYLYYVGGSLLSLQYNGPQNPILIEVPTLAPARPGVVPEGSATRSAEFPTA